MSSTISIMTVSDPLGPAPASYPRKYMEGHNSERGTDRTFPEMRQSAMAGHAEESYRNPPHKVYRPQIHPQEHPLQYSQDHPLAPVGHIIHQPYQAPISSIVSNIFKDDAGPTYRKYPASKTLPRRRTAKKITRRRDDSNTVVPECPSTRYTSHLPEQQRIPTMHVTESSIGRLVPLGPSSVVSQVSKPSNAPLCETPAPSPPSSSSGFRLAPGPSSAAGHQSSAAPSKIDLARSMQISGLISPTETRPGPIYKISMRQQPKAARACGFGERDRRVIDPPPILEMSIEDPDATKDEIKAKLKSPYSVMHCTLWNEETDTDDGAMPDSGDRRQQRRLMGNLVSSPFVGLDEHNVEGCFFTFPDLSCRTSGRYRLRFVLVVLDPMMMRPGRQSQFRSTVISDVFTVYAAKDFPGMKTSTALTKRLKNQGCLISVKKGSDKPDQSGKSTKADIEDQAEEEDAVDDATDLANTSSKRQKN